jgi:hypothetical protein
MVIDGSKSNDTNIATVKFERDRIRLPARFVELAGLVGKVPIDLWFLVISPGRYRLLKQQPSAGTGELSTLIRQVEQIQRPGDLLDLTDGNAEAALAGRLIPGVASPRGPGWRIDVPKVIKTLASERAEPQFAYLLVVAGFVEVWFPETLREAMSVPISDLLP